LEKKNFDLTSKLSAERVRYEKKTSELRGMISELKSSLAEKDDELSSSAADLVSRKDAYFRLERENADISLSYDKLLAKLGVYHQSAETSKFKAITDAYKLGYLDCTNGSAPLYAIGDQDIETLCPDLFHVQSEKVDVVSTGGAEEQATEEALVEEDGAEEDVVDEVVADVAEQVGGAAESVAAQVDAEEVADQLSPADISE
jgi:peptidoglycan hydrolase CwlO-like protein